MMGDGKGVVWVVVGEGLGWKIVVKEDGHAPYNFAYP